MQRAPTPNNKTESPTLKRIPENKHHPIFLSQDSDPPEKRQLEMQHVS